MIRGVAVLTAVVLALGGASMTPVAADEGADGRLTGRVVDPDGRPRAQVFVRAYADVGGVATERASATTDVNGRYDLGPLATGLVRVQAGTRDNLFSQDYQATFAGGADTYARADDVAAEAGATRDVPDIVTPLNGFISGRVVDAAGSPVRGIWVRSTPVGDETIGGANAAETTSDAFGRWTLRRRQSDWYQLRLRDQTGTYRDGVFDGTTTLDDPYPPLEQRASITVSPAVSPVVTITMRPAVPRMGYSNLGSAAQPLGLGRAPVVGETVRLIPGELTPSTTRIERITWTRDFVPIPGAEGPEYTIRPEDAGRGLGVKIVLSNLGVTTEQSSLVSVVAGTRIDAAPQVPSLAIYDTTPVVGQVLSAVSSQRVLEYQWFRGSRRIAGATRSTYRTSRRDLEERIVLRARVQDVAGSSQIVARTALVHRARLTVRVVARSTGDGRVTLGLTGSVQGLPARAVDARLRVSRVRPGSDVVGTVALVDGRRSVTLKGQPSGRQTYYVTVVGVRDRITSTTSRKVTVRVR